MTASDQDDLTKMLAEQMRTGFAQMAEQIKDLRVNWDQQIRDMKVNWDQQIREIKTGQDQIQRDIAIRFVPRDILDIRLQGLSDAIARNESTVKTLQTTVDATKLDIETREKALKLDVETREKALRKELSDHEISKTERFWARIGYSCGIVALLVPVLEHLHIIP